MRRFGVQLFSFESLSCQTAIAASAGLAFGLWAGTSAAETRTFTISWLTQAVYSQDGDCAGGVEPTIDGLFRKSLGELGKSPKEIDTLLADFKGGNFTAPIYSVMVYRGRVDGNPVNVYDNPTSVPDPHIHTVTGKFAPGFNLNGKIEENGFEDPDTHERGIDNQYFRALGCFSTHRAAPPARPLNWEYMWGAERLSMRAWLISISGENLKADGPVTVTFNKALSPVMLNANGEPERDQTFSVDQDPRTRSVFQGRIKDGVVKVDDGTFDFLGTPLLIQHWEINKFHLRLTANPDGSMSGIFGGYQSWSQIYFMYAAGAWSFESMIGLNIPGIYYALRNLADADPDPRTGQNMSISAAYRIEIIPAMLAPNS